jgi:purine-binding chemotaxis protein CheW
LARGDRYLVCQVGAHACALPLTCVVETMRPQPVETLSGAPGFIMGLSIIRGAGVPVVDVAALLGRSAPPSRFVTIRTGSGVAALATGDVLGVRALGDTWIAQTSPLLGELAQEVVAAVAAADQRLVLVLQASRIVPGAVWRLLEHAEVAP